MPRQCDCANSLDAKQLIADFGAEVALAMFEGFGQACPVISVMATQEAFARMLRAQVFIEMDTPGMPEEELLFAVEAAAVAHSQMVVETMARILKEEKNTNASH